jgi:hypothetical protein
MPKIIIKITNLPKLSIDLIPIVITFMQLGFSSDRVTADKKSSSILIY